MTIDCRLGYGETDYCGDQYKFGCRIRPKEMLPSSEAEIPENYAGQPRQMGKRVKKSPDEGITKVIDSPKDL